MRIVNDWKSVNFDEIVELYNSVGWANYTEDLESLRIALDNTSYLSLVLDEENRPIALARSISDDVSIHYLQDILVNPMHHRKGLGRRLLEASLERYKHVRTHMILTDDEEKQLRFYESLGYKNTRGLKNIPLNAFVKIAGVDLD